MLQPGDIVRYLNSTGGGRVVRIDGNLAYVDEDGFETPILARECVVVAHAGQEPSKTTFVVPVKTTVGKPASDNIDAPRSIQPAVVVPEPLPEEEELPGGDRLNVTIAFEPVDIKRLSETTFDAFLVNDSNYYLDYVLMSREKDAGQWTLRASGTVEPNIQLLIASVDRETFPHLDHIALQYIAYKRSHSFTLKNPGVAEISLDTTKFCKLHCFGENIYFDTRVLAFELIKNDQPRRREKEIDARRLEQEMMNKTRNDRRPVARRRVVKHSVRRQGDIIEVDLHVNELLDNTRGMSNADILNRQIDEFCRVMDANIRNHGQKIVFIHGKGEGVLRQALMKELKHRYKGHDVQDASFREYGFGATQVTIR